MFTMHYAVREGNMRLYHVALMKPEGDEHTIVPLCPRHSQFICEVVSALFPTHPVRAIWQVINGAGLERAISLLPPPLRRWWHDNWWDVVCMVCGDEALRRVFDDASR